MSKEDTILDYEKMIWQIFSVGVTASVIILYNVIKIDSAIDNFKVPALIIGFSILIYSLFSTLGYGTKKSELIKMKESSTGEKLSTRLGGMWYPRTRWMGEVILILIGFCYFVAFYEVSDTPALTTLIDFIPNWLMGLAALLLMLPIIILMIAIILCIIANPLMLPIIILMIAIILCIIANNFARNKQRDKK